MTRKNWQIKGQDKISQRLLADELLISPIIAQLLINRNIKTCQEARGFLKPSLLNLHDPFLMKGMKKAVARIKGAIARKEKIMVYGDYDVDGISATALLSIVLKKSAGSVEYYIPNRLEEGYGLNQKAIGHIYKRGVKLLITVDCGITSRKEIEELNRLGIDVIVTDHHNPAKELPDAHVILNPLQKACRYPDKNLSGVGVAFKLCAALTGSDDNSLYEHLDLVCLGTVADVVSLIGENRILVKNGLDELTHTKKAGLRALIDTSYLKGKDMTSRHVGYILGPRINATGRLGSPELSLKLLLTDDTGEAIGLAKILEQENRNRQKMEESVLREAIARVEKEVDFTTDKIIVLGGDKWHKGVIGIVASRLVDKFYRPTVMISMDGNECKGSARSIKNFHLFEVLNECSDLLKNYGGHSHAAGLTLHRRNMLDFKEKINNIAQKKMLAEDLIPTVDIDMEIPISSLSKNFLSELDELSPFGLGNPQPVFASRNLNIRALPQVIRRGGVKMWVTDGRVTAEAIGFNMADYLPSDPLNRKIDLAYTCNLNTYKGITSIQLQLKDMKTSECLGGNIGTNSDLAVRPSLSGVLK